jgi:archaellum biogenesis protein FlaJ (TadC family)
LEAFLFLGNQEPLMEVWAMKKIITVFFVSLLLVFSIATAQAKEKIVHDSEYYILEAQNGENWAAVDILVEKKLD